MTTRPLDLTQRQVRALCEGARKAGYVPVVYIGKTVVQLIPADKAAELLVDKQPVDEAEDIRL